MIRARILTIILLGALVAGPLAGCQAQESPSADQMVITFACQRSDLSVYQDAAETFHQANPSIDVRVIPLDDIVSFPLEDETDTLGPVRQLASHTDTFIWTTGAVEGGPGGLVLDLSSFIESDGEPSEADFLPGLLPHFQWQGGIWGLPAAVEPLVVIYDQATFDTAGLKPPAHGWTWDDLFDAAQQLTQREGKQIVRYGFADFGLGSVRSAVEAQGGSLVDDSAEPPAPTLDDPHIVAAVQWYTDLALTQEAMANPAEMRFADSFGVVQQGEAAMSVNPAQFWVDREHDDRLGVAPLPGGSPVWLRGYFVSAGAAHPEAAWRWLRFLSQQVTPPDRLPARQSLIPDSPYASAAGEEALEIFRYAAAHALPPVHPAALEVLLRQAVERVFEGEEAEDALAEAHQQALSLSIPGAVEPFAVPSPAPAEAAVETITFVTFLHQRYVALAEAFHESHPDIKVVVRNPADFDYRGGPPAEMIEASNADCFKTSYPAYAPALRQAALNLQPFVDADPNFPLDDYLPWTLERVRYGGELWGLPAGVSVNVLWYNRTLFDEAGLAYPEGRWSWDDVFLTARRLAGGEEGDQCYGIVIWPDIHGLSLLEAIGGSLVDESAAPPTFRFDAPEVVAAARQLRSLVQDEIVPTPEQLDEHASHALYTLIWANRVGMWADSAKGFDNQDFDFHPVPLPRPGRCHSSSSSAYYIAADTPHAEACWEWLRFLSEHIPDSNLLPPRRSLLTSDAFCEQVGAEAQAVYLETLECEEWGWLPKESLPPYASHAVVWLDQAMGEILWQSADAQATLSQAQQRAEAYLDCLRQRPDLEDQASAEVCFQEVDAP